MSPPMPDPSTGASVYLAGSLVSDGGTSLAAPLVASVYALAGGVGPSLAISLPYCPMLVMVLTYVM